MTLTLFEFRAEFMNATYSIKLTQFEKIGLIDKNYIPLENLKIEIHFRI